MNNQQFLQTVKKSFIKFLRTHSRSNKKLIVLHGAIADDIKNKLGREYGVKSLGLGSGKEGQLAGRYMEKIVDILISKNEKNIAGIGIKFVMNNYSQNSNNYFENMLGETANIRTNNKEYFQVLILPEEMPYYNKAGKITKWEKITSHNIDKYIALSRDNTERYLHTPIKTLLLIIKFPECDHKAVTTKLRYKKYYLNQTQDAPVRISTGISGFFGNAIILNDYELFIKKIVHYLKSI
ncbi:MAG TPA: hypothetical protein DEB73_01400 [Candidatus Magasanikbacteria bacterium]|uniref:Uncharacterized protein n=2 Tax=Candidatus Magasanikiibacteriota TaxID=1752731 RepID=A0A0G0YSZ1_9BACT|nr:MAG: hypothetical protein UU49_C0032G0012 [Candidatus Magasanikbacteria bacterium GW2011_GWC2_41_17]KKS12781.1 MAG: hypothetical protein UU69_C0023G0007 [Candidatus Magasanikbacteria bacterium GW2011_GWA2_41_55]HBV57905.1 hypothetical protein [Candidatus Magasanikbacteria bacterium]HBX15806.1 hypothetical protein [Candidatus Magasanikbacteria bacterium]